MTSEFTDIINLVVPTVSENRNPAVDLSDLY